VECNIAGSDSRHPSNKKELHWQMSRLWNATLHWEIADIQADLVQLNFGVSLKEPINMCVFFL
jgi:hypothetical protein